MIISSIPILLLRRQVLPYWERNHRKRRWWCMICMAEEFFAVPYSILSIQLRLHLCKKESTLSSFLIKMEIGNLIRSSLCSRHKKRKASEVHNYLLTLVLSRRPLDRSPESKLSLKPKFQPRKTNTEILILWIEDTFSIYPFPNFFLRSFQQVFNEVIHIRATGNMQFAKDNVFELR